jgi:hypothetical protein
LRADDEEEEEEVLSGVREEKAIASSSCSSLNFDCKTHYKSYCQYETHFKDLKIVYFCTLPYSEYSPPTGQLALGVSDGTARAPPHQREFSARDV